jgi:catechol 2,3-dioxygenase-like lactoylglutathione lyase family enzyme
MNEGSTAVFAVKDVTEAVRFYVDVLGFSQRWLWGNPPTFGCIGLGRAEVFICQQPELASKVEGHMHCFFTDGDIDALHARHRAAGATIVSPIENKPWGVREYTVRDISGYHLRFGGAVKYERPKTARASMPPGIEIEVAAPSAEEYESLLKSVDWAVGEGMAEAVLRRTAISVLARDGAELVGIARATGDGRNFTIWDVVVRPAYQGQKIGTAVLERMLAEIRRTEPHAQFIGLFTGKPAFYERLGFVKDGGMHRAP